MARGPPSRSRLAATGAAQLELFDLFYFNYHHPLALALCLFFFPFLDEFLEELGLELEVPRLLVKSGVHLFFVTGTSSGTRKFEIKLN